LFLAQNLRERRLGLRADRAERRIIRRTLRFDTLAQVSCLLAPQPAASAIPAQPELGHCLFRRGGCAHATVDIANATPNIREFISFIATLRSHRTTR
jgi:hypothetical protein